MSVPCEKTMHKPVKNHLSHQKTSVDESYVRSVARRYYWAGELASSFSETLQFLMAMNNDSFYEYLS